LICDQKVTCACAVDPVFKALSDATRRSLLDELFREDGQTLSALEESFPISRFAVMKHLRQLEEAGLVVTRRRGREKLHFLNPIPIRLIHDRWVSKFAEPWAGGLTELKREMEERMEKVFEIYIRTTPERLWQAITDSETRGKYNFGARVYSDWKPGSRLEMKVPGDAKPSAGNTGNVLVDRLPKGAPDLMLGEGEVLEVDPPKRLVHTMVALWSDDVKSEGASTVTWEIEQVADSCRLTVTHSDLREGANEELYGGWPMVLSGLKTWLETGTVLTTPGSLMYT
jgi:uncharacterized protein YndB with AHSA1/START domain/DNA-binding transcriptional ArsR family regulator